jgi:hypothetical protein
VPRHGEFGTQARPTPGSQLILGEKIIRAQAQSPTASVMILKEYAWLWLLRDGAPSVVSNVCDHHVGPTQTPEERVKMK